MQEPPFTGLRKVAEGRWCFRSTTHAKKWRDEVQRKFPDFDAVLQNGKRRCVVVARR